jgi:hypothetical protein
MLVWAIVACAETEETAEAVVSASLRITLENVSEAGALQTSIGAADITLSPALVVTHTPEWALFHAGDKLAGTPVERLAEDGNPTPLADALAVDADVFDVTLLAAQDETTYEAAAMGPGGHASVLVEVRSDQRISFFAMFGQSNDVLVATPPGGVSVLKPDGAIATLPLSLFDAGTERNEEPGAGASQAPRQPSPDSGEPLERTATRIDGQDTEGWNYPDPIDFAALEATLEP